MNASPPLTQRLIAHRGYSQCYPENTLVALREALRIGARYVEFDVQFSADRVPMVFHDERLKRVAGVRGRIFDYTAAQLKHMSAGEPKRFAEKFRDEPIPRLVEVLPLLEQWSAATAFVEIKQETVTQFGVESVARQMVDALTAFQSNCILISFDASVLQAARHAGMQRIGWVVSRWDTRNHRQAEQLAPDVLFCNYKKIPKRADLWPGDWRWALYDIVDPALAVRWFSRGADLLETWDIGTLLHDPRLQVATQIE